MNRAELTALYLEEIKRRSVPAGDILARYPESEGFRSIYFSRFLSRPLFLGHSECGQLHADLVNLRAALASLPARLFGGDLARFARAVGMTEVQVSAILRSRGTTATMPSRADLYTDPTGFKLLELNLGSAIAGIDTSDMCRALVGDPVLGEFVRTHGLGHVDSMREHADNIRMECGSAPGSRPVLAVTDWPSSFPVLEPYMHHFASRFQQLGIDAHPCHLGQLEARDGRVWLGERPIDIIQRLFMVNDLLESPDAPALVEPILAAAARGEVSLYTPMDSELFASKAALAMLSDEQNRSLFDRSTLASLDRILPWTRMVRPGLVTLEDGRRVDLLDYALSHQPELALKPTLLHSGKGIRLGWREDITGQDWEAEIRAAMDGPFVVQRRIRPVPELFPTDDGDPAPWIVNWGVFTIGGRYTGVYARGTPVDAKIEVINIGAGAYSGCCLHVQAGAGPAPA